MLFGGNQKEFRFSYRFDRIVFYDFFSIRCLECETPGATFKSRLLLVVVLLAVAACKNADQQNAEVVSSADDTETGTNGQDSDDTGTFAEDTENTDTSSHDSEVVIVPFPGCDETYANVEGPIFDQTNNRFIAQLWDMEDHYEGSFSGKILNGPPLMFHKEADRMGNCRLLTYNGDACEPPCNNSQYCIDGRCQTPPTPVPAGPLHLGSSNGIAETILPNENKYYRLFEPTEMADLEWVSMKLNEVSLTACMPEPIEPNFDFSETFAARKQGEDVTMQWTLPVLPSRIYIRMTTCIATHGGISPVDIECEGKDVGELTIPGSFLDALACDACWGQGECGAHKLIRSHTREASDTEGTSIQLRGQTEQWVYYYPSES